MRRVLGPGTAGAIGLIAAALGMSACGTTYGTTTPPTHPAPRSTVSSVTITGLGTVLTAASGRTLYYLKTESQSSIQCTSSCTSTWHPYLVAHGATATKPTGVTGKVSTTTRPEGTTQVTFNGHPVYTFAGDTASGQTNGDGASGVWFAVRTSGSATSGHPTYGY